MRVEKSRRRNLRLWLFLLQHPWKVLFLTIVVLGTGYYFFTGWRARDLAAKARENFERGNHRLAWVQLNSARELRPDDPEVLRAGAMLEAKFGRPEALDTLRELEKKVALREEETADKAKVAMRFGDETEFEDAMRQFEASGNADAVTLRTTRAVMRGDLDRAIGEARRALATSDNAEVKLELARLLGKRHGHVLRNLGRPAAEDVPALQEAAGLIDSLQKSELADAALALGLGTAAADGTTKKRWAEAAMQKLSPTNPALLPAAEFLVRSGTATTADMRAKLRKLYDTAPVAQRADFALWLSRQELPKDALGLVTVQEAADDTSAFLARTDALGRLGNWEGVLEAADAAEKVPDSMRQLTRVWALLNVGDQKTNRQAVTTAVEAAVQAASREKQLRPMLSSLDSIGAGAPAEAELARLCANPGTTDAAFSLLRERLGRTGGTAALGPAYERAKQAAPGAPSVLDHGRYLELFGGLQVKATDTEAAIAAHPAEVYPRVTHALLMLRKEDASAAKATFGDITVFFDQMIPAHQVIVASFTAGGGDMDLAQAMRSAINTDVLTPGEKALLDKWVPAGR